MLMAVELLEKQRSYSADWGEIQRWILARAILWRVDAQGGTEPIFSHLLLCQPLCEFFHAVIYTSLL